MRLPIPIFYDDKIYTDVDITEPETQVLTRAYESMKLGNAYKASLELVAGGIEAIYSNENDVIEDRAEIKKICSEMPYTSAETVCLLILADMTEEDVLVNLYTCPVCKKNNIPMYDPELGIDTRDRILDLEIVCMDNFENEITAVLKKPVELIDRKTKEVFHKVESITIKYPTIKDCIIACQNSGNSQSASTQIKIYQNAMIKINGEEIDRKFISVWGKVIFDKLKLKDLKQFGNAMQKYGIAKTIKKQCIHCGFEWPAVVDTSDFFVSGLLPE